MRRQGKPNRAQRFQESARAFAVSDSNRAPEAPGGCTGRGAGIAFCRRRCVASRRQIAHRLGARSGNHTASFELYDIKKSSVRATRPTTWTAYTFTHLIKPDSDAAFSCLVTFRRGDPAYPLVACERGDIHPYILYARIRFDCFSQICRHLVHGAPFDLLPLRILYRLILVVFCIIAFFLLEVF
jgi:hypothetical protein